MLASPSALPRWAVLLASVGVVGGGCGGRTGEDFPLDPMGEGSSFSSGGRRAQGGAASQGGSTPIATGGRPPTAGGSPPTTGGSPLATGGRPPTSGGRGGAVGSGGTVGSGGKVIVGGAGTGGRLATCGNGVLEAGEACDLGRGAAKSCGYGVATCVVCDPSCQWAVGEASFCGDGKLDPAYETCDDGDTETDFCAYDVSACVVCDSKCQKVPGATSRCGDGKIDPRFGEQCDDGGTETEPCAYQATACRVCDAKCREVPGATSWCGDGKLDPKFGEECDDGNTSTEPCAYGQTSCAVCGSRCTKVGGIVSYCGDGKLDSTRESCDPGGLPTPVCDYGKTSCRVCNEACSVVPGKTSYCGDGVVDSSNGELCDLGKSSATCSTACPQQCGSIPGPPLNDLVALWPSSGLVLTAISNAQLQGFVFNNQGKQDIINLQRLSDGVVVASLAVAEGSAPALPIDVFWNLTAGESYALYSTEESNGRWSDFTDYPTAPSGGIRVETVYSLNNTALSYWFTFTDLRSCPR